MTHFDPKRQLDSEEMADMTDRAWPLYAVCLVTGLMLLAYLAVQTWWPQWLI